MIIKRHETPWQREWQSLMKKEARLLQKRLEEEAPLLEQALSGKVPPRVERALTSAFQKAFSLVLHKGNPLIEKTYSKENRQHTFRANLISARIRKDRKSLKAFSKEANIKSNQHVLLAGVEGGLLGFLGIGLPDIPLFCGVLLRSLYEISMSYGFSYDTEEEQRFLLRVIEAALLRGEAFALANEELNRSIDWGLIPPISREEQEGRTSSALSSYLLYLKFIQGIPMIGAAGGLSDGFCLRRVTAYAQIKYKRRFLQQGKLPHLRAKLD